MQPSNVFNDEFCRACFIHHNNCTIPKHLWYLQVVIGHL
jgi:hypothetical protein